MRRPRKASSERKTLAAGRTLRGVKTMRRVNNGRRLTVRSLQPVRRELLGEALDELQEEPVVELRWCEANWLVDVPFDQQSERQPYLLRALIHSIGTADFRVYEDGTRAYVSGLSFGRGDFPMRRWAVVALLKQEPETVYVTCSMAE